MKSLEVYIDFKSPGAYLAMQPTLDLATNLNVSLHWLPFQTKQRALVEKGATESKGKTHARIRETARRNTHLHYAQVQGLEMDFSNHPRETTAALAALATPLAQPLKFIRAAFQGYWREQLDLNCSATVDQLLQATGNPANTSNARMQKIPSTPPQHKVIDTPAYIVAGQLFIGREHLPWITQLLE
ncbi:MAG: hypothetical protein GXP16_16370 [Gammaproteobacteria bacterium]|nr:hypothetical protein [Gammaproteobacteria bacterium]